MDRQNLFSRLMRGMTLCRALYLLVTLLSVMTLMKMWPMHNAKAFFQGKLYQHAPTYAQSYIPEFIPTGPKTNVNLEKFVQSSTRYVLSGSSALLKNAASTAVVTADSECVRALKDVAFKMADEIKGLCSEFVVGNELASALNKIMYEYSDCPEYTEKFLKVFLGVDKALSDYSRKNPGVSYCGLGKTDFLLQAELPDFKK